MSQQQITQGVEKLPTQIPGMDLVTEGGLPKGRTTLISGTAGSAKTVMACQFLVEGIVKSGENGVFVAFEESPEYIRTNMLGFGWDVAALEEAGQWAFVDASPQPNMDAIEAGTYDLGALIARIEHAVNKVNASRLSLDSLGAIFSQFTDGGIIRRELFRISTALKNMGVTAILTAERTEEFGEIARFGVEEFVTDNVIILRNALEHGTRRRTMEILKFRGTGHQKGEYPFTIIPNEGVVVLPLDGLGLKHSSSNIRISSGVDEMDKICGGGFFRDSVSLVSGATGTGKTLTSTHFVHAGANSGERCLFFAFEENVEQLVRNATGWGIDFNQMIERDLLHIVAEYPEVMGLEDHLVRIRSAISEFQPSRVVVDTLSALERVSTVKSFREFVIGLTSFIKHQKIAGLFTSTTPSLMGGTSITEAHISTITDAIILMRYVEVFGEMRRGITVLKMRGSMHDKEIREFTIDNQGMHIGKPFRGITGIMSGNPMYIPPSDISRFDNMFTE